MCAFPSPGGLRTCVGRKCSNTFTPTTQWHTWCSECRANGTQRRQSRQNYVHAIKGRVCKHCGIPDRLCSFIGRNVCRGCVGLIELNGTCPRCKGPLHNQIQEAPAPYCFKCFPPPIPEHYVPVVLLHKGVKRTIYKSRNSFLYAGGRRMGLRSLDRQFDEIVLRVIEQDFYRGTFTRPLEVKGVTHWSDPWEEHFAAFSRSFRDDLYDLNHYVQLGEAHPMEFKWYWSKFCRDERGQIRSKQTAQRRWERLKRKLRDSAIPFELSEDNQVILDPKTMATIAALVLDGSA